MKPHKEGVLEFVQRKLEQRKGILPRVAMNSGVPYGTLVKIAQGITKNPRIDTVERLASYFLGDE